jgi:hypothetical protein
MESLLKSGAENIVSSTVHLSHICDHLRFVGGKNQLTDGFGTMGVDGTSLIMPKPPANYTTTDQMDAHVLNYLLNAAWCAKSSAFFVLFSIFC